MNKLLLIPTYMLFLFVATTGCQQKPDSTKKSETEKHTDHDHEHEDDHEGHDHAPGEGHDDHEGHDHAPGEGHDDEHEGHDHAPGGGLDDDHEGHDHAPGEGHDDEHEPKPASHNESNETSLIEFPLALQKDFGITTAEVAHRSIYPAIRATGEIKSAGTREAEVVAPFAGILVPDKESGLLVRPGERVSKGTHLAMLAPSTDEDGWITLYSDHRLARTEYDRVKSLAAVGAVSERRLQEAQVDLQRKEARLRAALGGADPSDIDTTDMMFHLRAPISGFLADVHLRFNQRVATGEHLFNIVDPTRVWLEARVPATEAARLKQIRDAYFTVGGSPRVYLTEQLNGTLISVGGLLDPVTRRVSVIMEIDNPDGTLAPGSYAQVNLREDIEREVLAIPVGALLDEDGIPVAIKQVGAEDFQKVVLRLGARDYEFAEVLQGLSEGEKVVVEGAYKVKLAATKPTADAHAGHGH